MILSSKLKWILVGTVFLGALARGLPDFALMGARARGSEARSALLSLVPFMALETQAWIARLEKLATEMRHHHFAYLDCKGGLWLKFDSVWREDAVLRPVYEGGVEQCEGSRVGFVLVAVAKESYFKNSRDVWLLRPSGQVLHLRDGYSAMDYWRRTFGVLKE